MNEASRISIARLLLWCELALACGLLAYEIPRRGIDPDEFEHLHAGFLVFQGDVPYRDFFEHHGPLLYYALWPLFKLLGPNLSVLWWGRLIMGICSLATLALTARIARRIGGPPAGLIAASLLAWTSIFHAKGIELRPDVPAALLVTSGIALALESQDSWKRWILIGILAGLATMLTQKSIVVVAGLTLAAMWRELPTGSAKRVVRIPLGIAFGGAIAWGMGLAAFAMAGAAGDLLHGTVVQLLTWPVRSRRWDQLRPTLAADLTVWIAGCAGIVAALRMRSRHEPLGNARAVLGLTTAFAIGSLIWVKATYAQYYLLWMPLLAILAADRLRAWSTIAVKPPAWLLAGAFGLLLAIAEFALAWRALGLNQNGPLAHLTRALGPGAAKTLLPLLLSLLAAVVGLWQATYRKNLPAVLAILAALGMFHAMLRNVDFALWSNRPQIAAVEAVHRAVGPEETVLDGFSGFGALRQHAYYYWWINEYSLALMTPEEREGQLLAGLKNSPPAAVIFDRNLKLLPPSVTDWIRENYRPSGNTPVGESDWLWLRNDRRPTH
jgi:hypothetical protein